MEIVFAPCSLALSRVQVRRQKPCPAPSARSNLNSVLNNWSLHTCSPKLWEAFYYDNSQRASRWSLLIFRSTNKVFLSEAPNSSKALAQRSSPRVCPDPGDSVERIWFRLMAHKWNANDDLLLTSPWHACRLCRHEYIALTLCQIMLAGKWSDDWSGRLKARSTPPPNLPHPISSAALVIWRSRGRCWRFIKVDKWTQEQGIMGNPNVYGNWCDYHPPTPPNQPPTLRYWTFFFVVDLFFSNYISVSDFITWRRRKKNCREVKSHMALWS